MTHENTTDGVETQAQQAERMAALEKLVAQLSLDKLMLESTIAVLEQRSEPVKKRTVCNHHGGGSPSSRVSAADDG